MDGHPGPPGLAGAIVKKREGLIERRDSSGKLYVLGENFAANCAFGLRFCRRTDLVLPRHHIIVVRRKANVNSIGYLAGRHKAKKPLNWTKSHPDERTWNAASGRGTPWAWLFGLVPVTSVWGHRIVLFTEGCRVRKASF